MAKPCPVSKELFQAKAPNITVTIDGNTYTVQPKPVTDGKSLGWHLSAQQHVAIDGVHAKAQIGLNITLTGSK